MKVFTTHDRRLEHVTKTVYDFPQTAVKMIMTRHKQFEGAKVILSTNIIHRTLDSSQEFPLKQRPENFLKVKKEIHGIIWKKGGEWGNVF